MRRSDELRAAWASSAYFGRSLPVRAVRLTFPSMLSHTIHPCRDLYPDGGPSSFAGSSLGHASLHRSYHGSAIPRYPPHWLLEKEAISGRQSSRNVAAGMLARAADQSLPATCATDSLARLRPSLPRSGSPPTGVCYHYSAQPSIAEAGLAPASMSQFEGCTYRGRDTGCPAPPHRSRRAVFPRRAPQSNGSQVPARFPAPAACPQADCRNPLFSYWVFTNRIPWLLTSRRQD